MKQEISIVFAGREYLTRSGQKARIYRACGDHAFGAVWDSGSVEWVSATWAISPFRLLSQEGCMEIFGRVWECSKAPNGGYSAGKLWDLVDAVMPTHEDQWERAKLMAALEESKPTA